MWDGLTAGVQRVLLRAAEASRQQGDQAVGPWMLVWSLACEENPIAEVLESQGWTAERLWNQGTPHSTAPVIVIEGLDFVDSAGTLGALDTQCMEALINAARFAGQSRFGAVALEHLFQSLLQFEQLKDELVGVVEQLSPPPECSEDRSETPLTLGTDLSLPEVSHADQHDNYRILDAAANRAREGLRVVEDFARFAWGNSFLCQELKQIRHELQASLALLPRMVLLSSRDTERDVGTAITTSAEFRRRSQLDVVQASLKRVQEACRSLEEYGKILDVEFAQRIEAIRYRSYTIEKAVLSVAANRTLLADHQLCLLVTESLCPHGSGPVILGALRAGVRMIQVREKSMSSRELVAHCQRVRGWTAEFGALMIVNDRADIAANCQADGVHLGQTDLGVAQARRIVAPDVMIGISTHTIEQARQAVRDGANYLGAGPTFPTTTKSFQEYDSTNEFPGTRFLQQMSAEIPLPFFAIGGITDSNLPLVTASGVNRIAVSSAICSAADPFEAASRLLDVLAKIPPVTDEA